MSIEKITSKIVEDGQTTVDELISNAERESDEILSIAKQKAEKILAENLLAATKEKEMLIERKNKVANIDGQKVVLAQKQELIKACIEKAVEKIQAMEKKEYIKFLVNALMKTGYDSGELIFNEKEKIGIAKEILEELKKALPAGKFVISEETKNIKGGFYLKQNSIYINMTVEGLVDSSKDELIAEVAAKLFQ